MGGGVVELDRGREVRFHDGERHIIVRGVLTCVLALGFLSFPHPFPLVGQADDLPRAPTAGADHRRAAIEDARRAGVALSTATRDSLADYVRQLSVAATPDDFVSRAADAILGADAFERYARDVGAGSKASGRGLGFAESLHRYLSRHIAVLEEPGPRPRVAAEVLRAEEGDPGERHALFSALLRAAHEGRDARRELDGKAGLVAPVVRPVFVGERLLTVLTVEGVEVWLDLSSRVAPFGHLPPELRSRRGWLAEPDGSLRPTRTPDESPYGEISAVAVSGTLRGDGRVRGRVREIVRGEREWRLRNAFHAVESERWNDLLAALADREGLSGELVAPTLTDPRSVRWPLASGYDVRGGSYLFSSRGGAFLPLPFADLPFPPGPGGPAPDRVFLAVRNVDLQVPRGTEPRLPRNRSIEREFGTYRSTYELKDGRLRARQRLLVDRRKLGEGRAAEWTEFADSVRADLRQVVEFREPPAARAEGQEADDGAELGPARVDREPVQVAVDAALALRDQEGAASELERHLVADPDDDMARARLGYLLLRLDRAEEAARLLVPLAREKPFHPHVLRNAAIALERAGRLDEAIEAYRLHLALEPFHAAAVRRLGALLLQAGDWAHAAEVLERAAGLDVDDPRAPTLLARALRRLGENDDALGSVEEALRRDPDYGQAREVYAILAGGEVPAGNPAEDDEEGALQPRLPAGECELVACRATASDSPPRLENTQEIQRALMRFYPRHVKEAGIGGRVELWIYVDAEGIVRETDIKTSSGNRDLDAAAQEVASQMRFKPALGDGEPTDVWVSQWITFEVL